MALIYLRRNPEHIRTAVLNGVAPLAFTNPLYHARGAQTGFDHLLAECASDDACRTAFPALGDQLSRLLAPLDATPVEVLLPHPASGQPVAVRLSPDAFAEALRVMLYSLPLNRRVPQLIDRAASGDFVPFAEVALVSNRTLRETLGLGLLLSVTCTEDVPRIDPATIAEATAGTFLGDGRVHRQRAVCEFWPRGKVAPDYAEPVRVDVPVLALSGTLDPVTPPGWGEEATRHLPRSRHVVVPGAHFVRGECVDRIVAAFLDAGSVDGLDTSCATEMTLPPFEISENP